MRAKAIVVALLLLAPAGRALANEPGLAHGLEGDTSWVSQPRRRRLPPPRPRPPRPVPPPRSLEQRLASLAPEVRRCVRRHVPWAAVTVRARAHRSPPRRLALSIRTFPHRPRAQSCVQLAVERALGRGPIARRPEHATHAWRIEARKPAPPDRPHVAPRPLSTERVRRMARGRLDLHRRELARCLELHAAQQPLTLRVVARPDGRLRLASIRVPEGTPAWRLRCAASVVHARRIAARPARAVPFVYRLAPAARPGAGTPPPAETELSTEAG